MATRREWLVSQGLAKGTRGKFSKEALDAVASAEAEGLVFDDTVKEVKGGVAVGSTP